MNKGLKNIAYLGMLSALMLVAIDPAMAQGLDRITNPVKAQLPAVADVLSIIAYIAGVGFGIKAALKLKESNESKGQVPLSQPITLAIVAGVLLALPTMLSVASESVFGAGNTKVNAAGTGMRTIN
jgi:hypothetical protein